MEHYFSKKPTSALKTKGVVFSFHNHALHFLCASGVFSSQKIDFATQLLLEHARLTHKQDVLDIGCGMGVIGISIKKAFSESTVVMTDVNKRALEIAKRNALKNTVSVEILESNLYEQLSQRTFDVIISNPPHHAGRELVYALIEQAPKHLNARGTLQIVAQHNKGGAMLERKMKDTFGNVEVLVKKTGFRVYCSVYYSLS